MSEINDITQQLAAQVLAVDPHDLQGLMRLHSDFQKVGQQLATGSDASKAASTAEEILERIVLHDETDALAALRRIESLVAEIQRAVDSAAIEPVRHEGATPEQSLNTNTAASTGFRAEDVPLITEFVTESREHLDATEAEVLKIDGDADPEGVNAIFRSFHTIKGVAGFLNLTEIGLLAHSAENLLDLARKGQLALDRPAIELILESIDAAKSMVSAIETAARQNSSLTPYARLDDLRARLDACAAGKMLAAPKAAAAVASKAPVAAATKSSESTVKVATDRLDSLINMVGELVITQSMVRQESRDGAGGGQRLSKNLARLDKITRELQDLSMSMRMVPIQGVFQKMVRLVRDLSGKFGKEIELNITGGDTELDRNVVEAISDPLMHMVRNAADHGIESAANRAKAGKPAAGHIELKAQHRAGQVVIEISDDGKGLNRERIRRKAIDAGILKETDQPSDADICRLIFHAGLSTAEKVTDVSGRGVGMDVVKKNVEALRGRIDIRSTEGAGSTFTICLPLTLAVIDGLIVRVGEHRYIIPILSVEQSIRPEQSQLSTIQNRGEICLVRGRTLPMLRMGKLFNVATKTDDATQALAVIVQDNGREVCLLVDELLGQHQVVIKSLDQGVGQVRGVSGAAILGDGSVSLILDVPGLIDLAGDIAGGD